MNKPHVSYPCRWFFTLIGSDEKAMQAAVAECLGDDAYLLTLSRKSRSGKYISLHLDTKVASEAERNRLFATLGATSAIKMVL